LYVSDEVNGDHIRRVTSSHNNMHYRPQNVGIPTFYQNVRQNISYRHFSQWRPRNCMNYYQFNLFFQRQFIPSFNMPRFQFYPRMHIPMFPRYFCNSTNYNERGNPQYQQRREDYATVRKRKRGNAKRYHLESIKNLAARIRHIATERNAQLQNVEALQKLIETYNIRYSTRVRLTPEFEVISDEAVIETITLDDEDDSQSKRRRIDSNNITQNMHLDKIREIAMKLKQIESEKKASARHRRAFSGLIKTYNKSYNADIYVNDNNEIIDKKCISLDTSSESDCVPEESPKVVCGKKLRNPFNILKRLSEKNKIATIASTSKQEGDHTNGNAGPSMDGLSEIFGDGWLPNTNDFGKPELVRNDNMNFRIIDSKKEEYLFEFMKDKPNDFGCWLDTKIAFLESIEESNAKFRTEAMKVDNVDIKSIVKFEDCTSISSVLEKLSIIKTNRSSCDKSALVVDFDVYNRDVQNFRKSDKPTPHFRIVCLE
jgi:hypothetical protein